MSDKIEKTEGAPEVRPAAQAKTLPDAGQFSNEQLMRMFMETQKQLADALKAQADALLESRKPYVDPRVLEQKRLDLEDRQRQIQKEFQDRINKKKNCPHVRENLTSNIKWQQHSNGIVKGVCGNCFSEFDTRNPEDRILLQRDPKGIKMMGRAGAHANRQYGGF